MPISIAWRRPSRVPPAEPFDYETKVWGSTAASLRPTALSALRLRYCLEDIAAVRGTLVEVGCGAGAFAAAIGRHRPDLRVIGLDLSARALLAARAAGVDPLVRGDAERLPLADESAQAIAFFDVLEHVNRPGVMLAEAARVLRPGGLLHAFVPCEGSLYTLHGIASRLGFSPKERYGGHIQRLTPGDLRRELRCAGLRVRRWRWSGHPLTQAIDLGYFTFLALRGRNVETTVEGLASRGRGLGARALGAAAAATALVGYAESRMLRGVPAVGVHVACVRD
jgi:SAM-dependent methyltransferase